MFHSSASISAPPGLPSRALTAELPDPPLSSQLELQHLSVMGARNIQTQILTLRDQLAVLYEHADQPIPFIYVHMVYLLTSAYLPIFSYGMAYIEMNPAVCAPGTGRRGGGCIRREGASEAAPQAVRQAVGGGCRSGWGRLLSVIKRLALGVRGTVAGHRLGALELCRRTAAAWDRAQMPHRLRCVGPPVPLVGAIEGRGVRG